MSEPEVDAAALGLIRGTPRVVRALLDGLPDELVERPNDEGWSLKDIVAHLHDVESGAMVKRIRRMLDEDRPFIRSIDPPGRLLAGGYASQRLPELLDELTRMRTEHADWLARLTPAHSCARVNTTRSGSSASLTSPTSGPRTTWPTCVR